MLAKLTSKNQLTLPKAAVQAVGTAEYFDVAVREGQIVLTPVRIQRGDAVRAKLAALGLTGVDVADAVRWVRGAGAGAASSAAAEPGASYKVRSSRRGKRVSPRKSAPRG